MKMKSLHTTALALVGQHLMMPPPVRAADDIAAPL
jgi:hypothetical protein